MPALTKEELKNRFSYHDPNASTQPIYNMIRESCLNLATIIEELCPDSRERSVALTKLDEVMFWANASIARRPA